VYVIGGFGIAGTVLTGIAARIEPSPWVSWLVIIVSLGFPTIIVVTLAGATVDGKDEKARVKEEERARAAKLRVAGPPTEEAATSPTEN